MLEFLSSFEVTVVESLVNFSSRDVEDRMAFGVVSLVSISAKIADVGAAGDAGAMLELITLFEVSVVGLLINISSRDVEDRMAIQLQHYATLIFIFVYPF